MKGNRIGVFFFTLIPVVLMSFWTISAFWQHIKETGDGGSWGPYAGAVAPEAVCIMLVIVHSFFAYISVRQAALWVGVGLAAVTIFHSVAMRGMSESINHQVGAEQRMKEGLADSSGSLAESMTKPLLAERNRPGTTPERKRQIDREISKLRTELGTNAQNNLAKEISGSTQKIYEGQVVSPDYIKNYGFLVLLGSSMLAVAFIGHLMMTKERRNDYDGDFNGVPDHEEGGASSGRSWSTGPASPSPSQLAERHAPKTRPSLQAAKAGGSSWPRFLGGRGSK